MGDRPGGVAREAYSHEGSSSGLWQGNDAQPEPAFYAYAYPEPAGFSTALIRPAAAYYHTGLREFILPYASVREARSPDAMLLDFLQRTYEAAAELGQWESGRRTG